MADGDSGGKVRSEPTHPEVPMRKLTIVVAEGAVVHLAITAAGLGALTAWARYCESRRHPA